MAPPGSPKACRCCAGTCGKKHTRVLGVTIALLILIALAIGVAMIALARQPHPSGPTKEGSGSQNWLPYVGPQPSQRRLFLIAIGDDYGPHEARNQEGGILGFGIDLVKLVCEEAGIQCETVTSNYDNCWVTGGPEKHSYGGKALHARWVDGCIGWFVTLQRLGSFTFSQPYLVKEYGYMFYKQGADFNPFDLEGRKIGFLIAWVQDEHCLAKKETIRGRHLQEGHAVYVKSIPDAIQAVENKEIDAFIGLWSAVDVYTQTKGITYKPEPKFSCSIGGSGIMTRKDSNFPGIWNVGFQKARYKGRFRRICEDANIKYSHFGTTTCLE